MGLIITALFMLYSDEDSSAGLGRGCFIVSSVGLACEVAFVVYRTEGEAVLDRLDDWSMFQPIYSGN